MTATDTRTVQPHGTVACFHRGCQRDECLTAGHRHNKHARVRRARGIPGVVDAASVAEHVADLCAQSSTCSGIAEAAGVSKLTVLNIASGKQARILATTAAAILAVRRPAPADMVDGTGTGRRLRALHALGHPGKTLVAATGLTKTHISDICNGRRPNVRRATADRVSAVFRELAAVPGPSDYTRAWAGRRGWPPPAAWNDDIDSPDARPHGYVRRRTCAELVEAADGLLASGMSAEDVVEVLGVKRQTLHKARWRTAARAAGSPA